MCIVLQQVPVLRNPSACVISGAPPGCAVALCWQEGKEGAENERADPRSCALSAGETRLLPAALGGPAALLPCRQASVGRPRIGRLVLTKKVIPQNSWWTELFNVQVYSYRLFFFKLRYNSHSVDFIYSQSCTTVSTILFQVFITP